MAYIGNTAETQGFTPAVDFFSGNGSTTAFTLSRPVASVAQVQATIENVPQNPGTAFTVSGNTITFDGAPPSGTNNIYVYYTSPITTFVGPWAQSQNGIYAYNNVGIGNTIPGFPLTVSSTTILSAGQPSIVLQGESNTERMQIRSIGVGGGQPVVSLLGARGTVSSPTATQSGDPLGYYQLGGHDGSAYNRSAWITGFAAENYSSTNRGSHMAFSTTPIGSTTLAERMRIDSAGNVGIGTSSPLARLHIEGSSTGAVQAFIENANGSTNSSSELVFGTWSGAIPTGTGNPGPSAKISAINMASSDARTDLAFSTYATSGISAEQARITSTGLFQFNSGYGSVATAFGCRAWVNFNGTGTVAIRASGNVSSITDNGTGDYTVNFTTAMPDANYTYTAGGQGESSGSPAVDDCFFNINRLSTSVQTGSIRVGSRQAGTIRDAPYYCVAIFR